MSKTLRNSLLSAVGIIISVVTFAVYLLFGFVNTPASNIGIAFVLFAELVFFGFIVGVDFFPKSPNGLFSRAGIISVLSLYFVGAVIMFIFSNAFGENTNSLWVFEIVTLTVALVIVIIIVLFSAKINSDDQGTISNSRLMQICEKRMFDLVSVNKNKFYEPQLLIILEKLKYTDKIGDSSVDEKIVGAIIKLEKGLDLPQPKVDSILEELISLISQRNSEMAEKKRGGF